MENKITSPEIVTEQRTEIWQGNEITQANYNFTALEINIMCMIFFKIREVKGDYLQYHFTFEEFETRTRLNSSNIYQLKQAVLSMQKKTFQYNTSRTTWISAPLISGVKIDSKEGIIYFNIDIFIKPLIVEVVKNTTRYFLETVFNLSGKHAKRLYHYFSMYKSIGRFTIDWVSLKSKLVSEDKYDRFFMFYKKVIEPAVKEINEISELNINCKIVKKYGGENVLDFYINEKKTVFENESQQKAYDLLKRDNLTEWFIMNTLKTLDVETIHKLHYTTQINAKRNKGAYLRALLVANGVPETKI